MTFPILASLLVRLVVLLPFQLLRLSLATPSRWTPLALSVFLRSEERFSRNAETDLVCRLLLEKKKPSTAPVVRSVVVPEKLTGIPRSRGDDTLPVPQATEWSVF